MYCYTFPFQDAFSIRFWLALFVWFLAFLEDTLVLVYDNINAYQMARLVNALVFNVLSHWCCYYDVCLSSCLTVFSCLIYCFSRASHFRGDRLVFQIFFRYLNKYVHWWNFIIFWRPFSLLFRVNYQSLLICWNRMFDPWFPYVVVDLNVIDSTTVCLFLYVVYWFLETWILEFCSYLHLFYSLKHHHYWKYNEKC